MKFIFLVLSNSNKSIYFTFLTKEYLLINLFNFTQKSYDTIQNTIKFISQIINISTKYRNKIFLFQVTHRCSFGMIQVGLPKRVREHKVPILDQPFTTIDNITIEENGHD